MQDIGKKPTVPEQSSAKKNINWKRWGYQPAQGQVWNPFTKFPPNYKCFCDSGRKFKKCCEPKLTRTIPANLEMSMKNKYRIDMIKAAQISGIKK